ncbi:UDP-N-acetylmuramoylalanine-D-glutamate ligase [Cutibacterium acnes JCM 18918]|nr:UDP-N-acetylmuramoylalanine-D-glutamate ligase [Cutibacterium acnes JCM 18918]
MEDADVVEGARAIGFTTGTPGPSMIGIVDGLIVDRAFVEQRATSAMELARLEDVHPFAPHNVENALAAAALTRSFGVPAPAVGQGLRDLHLGGHRIETVHQPVALPGSMIPRRRTPMLQTPRCGPLNTSCGSLVGRPRARILTTS